MGMRRTVATVGALAVLNGLQRGMTWWRKRQVIVA